MLDLYKISKDFMRIRSLSIKHINKSVWKRNPLGVNFKNKPNQI